jgi:hypothetical protein
MKKAPTDLLRAIASISGTQQGRVIRSYLEDLLSHNNKMAVYELENNRKQQLSGRSQQIYDILAWFTDSVDILDKRKNTK